MVLDKQVVAYRAGGFRPRLIFSFAAMSFVGIVVALEVLCRTGVIGALSFPAPSDIGRALMELYSSGQLKNHLGASLSRLAVGWSLGVSSGVVVGFAIGITTVARSMGIPWVAAVSAIPKIALLPLFIIWFGIGEGSKYATIAFGTFFPTVINTFGGVDNIQKNLVRMGQSFNLKKSTIILSIILPGTLPSILSAFRISSSIGIILLVAAEMVSAQYGIGAYIIEQQNLFQLDRLMAGVVVLMVIGLTIHGAIGLLEKWLLRWR
ncbi:ABC transporter permease [Desulfopila sp. IMCC35008]|uniref:ABC transporter permease n=1 Tax=Desulfopila sp. IMCC35008 TaxID=2653858 RepID=UPI0013D5BD90|nr:ABC transporter permease [Desulfopila sp. IMCC35008]